MLSIRWLQLNSNQAKGIHNMTYSESAEGMTITLKRALQELAKHGMDLQSAHDEFFQDLGQHSHYKAEDVLSWLGY